MKYLDKKIVQELQKYEEMMAFVVKTKSLSGYRVSDINNLYSIYTNATGDNINYKPTCSNCVFRLLDKVGRLYFDSKEQYNNDNETNDNETTEDVEKIVEIKRRGRKPSKKK